MESKHRIVAVIGSAGDISNSLEALAEDVGKMIVDNKYSLVNGGMGGVMQSSAKGAQRSIHYSFGCTIGVLPSYDKNDANVYIDIVIPTGLGVARNTIVVAMADIIIALDGGAGTLSELAMAWQMGKHIICIGDNGWHSRLDTMQLDSRDRTPIRIVNDIGELQSIVENLPDSDSFKGIQQTGY